VRAVANSALVKRSGSGQMMLKTFSWFAALAIVVAACSGTGTEEGSSSLETTFAIAPTETTAPTAATTTTISAATSTEVVTTTEAASTTSTATSTEPPGEVNPPDVEAWWCGTFDAAAGQGPVDFAQGLADDFRHGYTDVPADTLEEAANQAALTSCDPEYGRAVADALGG
jgi:hypothetical protein